MLQVSFRSALVIAWIMLLLSSESARADLRSDAHAVQAQLRQDEAALRLTDELRSLEATLATADQHHRQQQTAEADRFYQLAIQKAALIRQQLAERSSAIQRPLSSGAATATPEQQPDTEEAPNLQGRLIGSAGLYTVVHGDTIRLVAAKLGVSRAQLAAQNGLTLKDQLRVGQKLRYNNRRIIPDHRLRDGIVINIPDRMLYLFEKGAVTFATAVALGTPTKTDQFVWETPTGKFKIVNKAKDPTWTVPPSIQEEMRLEGREVITSIPPGPDNPLGKYAMKTSLPGILIHSTTKPWSIYTYASHGCIRVYPERMEELFHRVKPNSPGEIIYKPVKLAVTDDGKVLLEVHGDIYSRTRGLQSEVKGLIRSRRLEEQVDWSKVEQAIKRKAGVAEDVSRCRSEAQQQPAGSRATQSPS